MRIGQQGKAAVLFGGQFGSEGKGSIAAWLALQPGNEFTIATTNAGAQAGHTSVHKGKKVVCYHLPTIALYQPKCMAYLNAGSIIDVDLLFREIEDTGMDPTQVVIHPRAAIITQECKDIEADVNSSATRISSTQKGVGEALARKVRRSGKIANDIPELSRFVRRVDLNALLAHGASVAVEVPQGYDLSLNHGFTYPYCTSRDCTVGSGLSDAGIHPSYLGKSVMVIRSYPIRVGNIKDGNGENIGWSGPVYLDQVETTFDTIGVPVERTTVTQRIRRVFSLSAEQIHSAAQFNRPDVVALTFCNYFPSAIEQKAAIATIVAAFKAADCSPPRVILQWGPTTEDCAVYRPGEPRCRNHPFVGVANQEAAQ